MRIETYITPFSPDRDNGYKNTIAVYIDVLRASTSVCSALFNGAKEVIPAETVEKAIQIYNNLSKEVRLLCGERNGVKPTGFDAGNSPLELTQNLVNNKTIILTTTNGTNIFNKAKSSDVRLIAGFVNHSIIFNEIKKFLLQNNSDETEIVFLCAGNKGNLSFEDTLCAGSLINKLNNDYKNMILTDSTLAALELYKLHAENLFDFLKTCEHSVNLLSLGFDKDIEIAFTLDIYPILPIIKGNSIKKGNE